MNSNDPYLIKKVSLFQLLGGKILLQILFGGTAYGDVVN
jgi:hypothetical protein